jgi:hypothetical protein
LNHFFSTFLDSDFLFHIHGINKFSHIRFHYFRLMTKSVQKVLVLCVQSLIRIVLWPHDN